MKKDYLKNIDELSNRIKSESPKISVQKIKEVKKKLSDDHGHFNIWIPKDLLKRVRTFAVKHELTAKEIGIQALESYLKTKES